MKELPDEIFNMRRQFYEESKEYAKKKKRMPTKIQCYVTNDLDFAKKIPFWFRIEQIQNGYWQVWTCKNKKLLKELGQTIVCKKGIEE